MPHSLPLTRLLSVLLLATGMLLASTMTLKASWLWILGPVALLALIDLKAGAAAKLNLACLPFYLGLLGVAMAFNFAGLPATSTSPRPAMAAAGGCGSGGCGTAAGCGSGGCGASSGGACGCSSGSGKTATAKTAASSSKGSSTAKSASSPASNKPKVTGVTSRPVTTIPPNRPTNPPFPLPARATTTRPPTVIPSPTVPGSSAVAPASAPEVAPAPVAPVNASPPALNSQP